MLDSLWGAGTGTGVLAQATAALDPLQGLPNVAHFLTFLTVAGVLLAAGGAAWAWHARKKTEALNDALNLRPATPDNNNDAAPVVPVSDLPAGMADLLEDRDVQAA